MKSYFSFNFSKKIYKNKIFSFEFIFDSVYVCEKDGKG